MRGLRTCLRWGLVGVVLSAALACGAGEVDRTVAESSMPVSGASAATWPAGETFSSIYALQVLDVPELGTTVIDTAAEVEGEHRVAARWPDGDERTAVVDGSRPALIFPWAWSGQGHVYVAGFVCPEPALDDFDLLDVDRVAGCGGSEVSYVIRSFEVSSRRWSELDASIPAIEGRTVNVLAAGGRRAVFGGADEADPSRRVIYEVDLASGSRTELTVGIDGLWICEVDGELVGYRGGGIADGTGDGGTPGSFVRVGDDGVQDLGGTVDGTVVVLGCVGDAMVLWRPEERAAVLARYSGGDVSLTPLDMPAGEGTVHVVAQRNLGGAIAMWESHGTTFRLWQLEDDGWRDCDLEVHGLDPPDVVAVTGCVAVAVDAQDRIFRVGD